MSEDGQLPVPEGVLTPEQVLAEVRKLMESPVSLEEQRRIFQRVLDGHREQTKLGMLAVVRQRLDRTLKMMALMDDLRDRLFSEKRLSNLSTKEGVELFRLLSEEMTANLAFIEKYVDDEGALRGGKSGDVHFHLHGGAEQAAVEDAESRDRIRRFIEKMMRAAGESEPREIDAGGDGS